MRVARFVPAVIATFATVAGLSFVSTAANAATPAEQCIDADSSAQDARTAGQFEKASGLLHVCMADACPKRIRDDCTERWEELQKAQPTVILAGKDDIGADLSDVAVTIDGRPLASKLDGGAVRVDPGTHEFVFTANGQAPVSVRVVIRESEQHRVINALMKKGSIPVPVETHAAPVAATPAVASPADQPTASHASPWKTTALAGGGVGVASVVVGAVFGGLALSSKNKEAANCGSAIGASSPQACDAAGVSSASSVKSQAALSSAFIVGGAVLAAGGTVLYFMAPSNTQVGVGLGTISLSGAF